MPVQEQRNKHSGKRKEGGNMRHRAGTMRKKNKARKGRYVKNWKTLTYYCSSAGGTSTQTYGVRKRKSELWTCGTMKVASLKTPPLSYQTGRISSWNKAGSDAHGKTMWWKHSSDPASLRRFRRNLIAVSTFERTHKSGQTLRQYETARTARMQRIRMFLFLIVACAGLLIGAAFSNQNDGGMMYMRGTPVIMAPAAGNTIDGGLQTR